MTPFLIATLVSLTTGNLAVALPPADSQSGVKLTLNRQEYGTGEGVRVQVEPGEDGYLIVMRVDGDGRVRVLFPIDPDLDPFVRGGKRYELRGRDASETFKADDLGGAGIVFAALSKDPLRLREFAVGDHWNYETLSLGELRDDPEAALHRFVRRMSDDPRYAFDVQGYRVRAIAYADNPALIGYRDSYYDCLTCGYGWGSGISVSIGFGRRYDPFYDPYRDYGYWYSRYRYDPFYDPYWAYGYSPYYPPYYPGQYAPYTVINYRPRAVPNTHGNDRARPRVAGGFTPSITPRIGTVAAAVRPDRNAQGQVPSPRTPAIQDRARPGSVPATGAGNSGTRPSAPPQQNVPERRGNDDRGTVRLPPQQSTGTGSTPPATSNPGTRSRPSGDQSPGRGTGTVTQLTPPASDPPSRTATGRPVFREPTPVTDPARDRRTPPAEQRPVYREPERTAAPTRIAPQPAEPVRGQGSRSEPQREPQRSEPPRAEPRSEPPRSVSAPPETRAPERRPEPVTRAPAPSSPPASAPRTTPPPPPPAPPASSSGGRSRARGGG